MRLMPLRPRDLTCWSVLAGAVLATAGCGEERKRYPLTGTVTYRGVPVQMGSIRFEADGSVGNFAPICLAPITDGKYETPPEDSPTNGKYRVQVMAIDVPRIKKDGPPGTPWEMPALFPPYSTTLEVPPAGSVFDIVIPDAAPKAKAK